MVQRNPDGVKGIAPGVGQAGKVLKIRQNLIDRATPRDQTKNHVTEPDHPAAEDSSAKFKTLE